MRPDVWRMFVFCAVAATFAACGDNQTHPEVLEPYTPDQPAPLQCVPNLDGRITADEILTAFDVPVGYRINAPGEMREVNTVGLDDQNGVRVWDFTRTDASDRALTLHVDRPGEQWFASHFSDVSFISPISADGSVLGAYRRTEHSVALLGFASAEESPADGQTLVVYDLPVDVYRFPLQVGQNWISVGETSNAMVRGLPYGGRDTYHVTVEHEGEVWLPELRFERALKVRTDVSIEPVAGIGVTRKQISWVFECFGEIARVVSQDGETAENFTTAAEFRRLAATSSTEE